MNLLSARLITIIDDAARLYGEDLHATVLHEITETFWSEKSEGRVILAVYHIGEGSQGLYTLIDLGHFDNAQSIHSLVAERMALWMKP